MLTFTGTLARTNSFYGHGIDPITLINVECTGEEQNLLNCTYTSYEVASRWCYGEAGVLCPGNYNRTLNACWLSILVNLQQTLYAKLLCFPKKLTVVSLLTCCKIRLVTCTKCHFQANWSSESPETAIFVLVCGKCLRYSVSNLKFMYIAKSINILAPSTTSVNCTNQDLRLRGGTTSLQGRVEMCYEGQWGTVCDNLWGTSDAKVACRQLGFSSYGNLWMVYIP